MGRLKWGCSYQSDSHWEGGRKKYVLQIIHGDYQSQRCQCSQWWERMLPRSLIRTTWKTTAAAIKASAIKERMNKISPPKKGGKRPGLSLKTCRRVSQCHPNDLTRVLSTCLPVSALCSQSPHSSIPLILILCVFLRAFNCLIVFYVCEVLHKTIERCRLSWLGIFTLPGELASMQTVVFLNTTRQIALWTSCWTIRANKHT